MIRNLIVGLVTVIVAVLAIGFMLPQNVEVSRSILINSAPSNTFAAVDSFKRFNSWSPWSEKDPAMKVQLSGPPFGVGAHYEWSGNKAVGSGSQDIIESVPNSEVKIRVSFGGFDQPSIAVFSLEPGPVQGTLVTWELHTDFGNSLIGRYYGLLLDRMVGPDYERGLERLKLMVERDSKTDFAGLRIERVELQPQTIAYVSGSTSTDIDEIGKVLGVAYGQIGAALKSSSAKANGAPLAITRRFDPAEKIYDYDAGIPIDRGDAKLPASGPVKLAQTYAGFALKVQHKGPYSKLPETYALIDAFKQSYGLQDNGNSWEQYVDDPTTKPAADVITLIFVPIK